MIVFEEEVGYVRVSVEESNGKRYAYVAIDDREMRFDADEIGKLAVAVEIAAQYMDGMR